MSRAKHTRVHRARRAVPPVLVAVLLMTATPRLFAQHWTPPEPTGVDHSLAVTAATLDDLPLQPGDEVGVFTPSLLLAGAGVWPAEGALGVAVWGDDPLTTDVVEGFAAGEAMTFRVWIAAEEAELAAEAAFTSGPETFQPDGYSTLTLAAQHVSAPERSAAPLPGELRLAAWPNPFNPAVTLALRGGEEGWRARVVDLTGRAVRLLHAEGTVAVWDGRGEDGRPVASGVYLVHGLGRAAGAAVRIVKLE